jgi:excisionase family DNA binding protein
VPEALLTVQEAAEMLNVSAQTLRRMIWAREISYINIGTGPYIVARFKPEHIEEFLESREVSRYT